MNLDVVTLKVEPKGFNPCFTLIERAQTINKKNIFWSIVVKYCTMSARKVVNSVLLNHSTYGVSCDKAFNFTIKMKYLRGDISHIPSLYTNHNVKKIATKLWEALLKL